MIRIAFAASLIASVLSSRVQKNNHDSQAKFGASCEDLHVMFHDRVVQMQNLIDAHPDASHFTTATSARFMMRSYGIVRTMRRARTCSWLIDGDSDDIAQTRSIVQTLLAGNPCAEAARVEMETGRDAETAEIEMQSIYRAVSVLRSDNCEVTTQDFTRVEDEAELEAILEEEDANAQDNVDVVMNAVDDEIDEIGSAFAQTSANVGVRTFTSIMRTLGAIFLFLFLMLACAGTVMFLSAAFFGVLTFFLAGNFIPCDFSTCGVVPLIGIVYGGAAGGALGVWACSNSLYNKLF